MKLPITLLLALIWSLSQGQNIETLLSQISNEPIEKKVNILEDSTWSYINRNFAKARIFANATMQVSKSENHESGIAIAHNTLGIICRKEAQYEKSMEHYHAALDIWKRMDNLKQMANLYQNMANVSRAAGDNEKAHKYISEAFLINEELDDSVRVSASLSTLGNILKDMGKNDEAMKAYLDAARIDEALGDLNYLSVDYSGIADLLLLIGEVENALNYYKLSCDIDIETNDKLGLSIGYGNMGVAFKDLREYDSAKYYYNASLAIATEIKDSLGIAEISYYMAGLNFDLGDFQIAINNYEASLSVGQSLGDQRIIGLSNYGLGQSFTRLNRYEEGIVYLKKANEVALASGNSELEVESFEELANAYEKLGKPQLAYEHLLKYITRSDSINAVSVKREMAEIEAKYQTEKKEQQIELLNKENQLQSTSLQRNQAVIAILVLLTLSIIGLGLWFYKRAQYQNRVKLEKEKARLKTEQTNAVIGSQEEERKRFAMDLHDNFGQLISALRLLTNQSEDIKSKSNQVLDQMYASLKEIAFDLMPQTLLQKGLVPALEELVTQLNRNGAVRFSLNTFDEGLGLSQESQIATYRIAQELINNNLKYAKAQNVNISITALEDSVNIMIEDDGIGFDTETLLKGAGNGWRNINSRLDLLNGEINFDSEPGSSGTTVLLNIPYSSTVKEAA